MDDSAIRINIRDEVIDDHAIRMRGAFIGMRETIQVGSKVGGEILDCYFYGPHRYTPPLFRRPRLARFAPIAQRCHFARAAWRWAAVDALDSPEGDA